jgi:hypothetical protein
MPKFFISYDEVELMAPTGGGFVDSSLDNSVSKDVVAPVRLS